MNMENESQKKERADQLLFSRGLARSRSAAAEQIERGTVSAGGVLVTKASKLLPLDAEFTLTGDTPYVGRGGLKLHGAIEAFIANGTLSEQDIADAETIDIGSSTGGFTECLLRKGAKHVLAVDVGTGQFDAGLAKDPRITVREGTDIRTVAPDSLSAVPSFAVADVSFISLSKILPSIERLLAPGAKAIVLVKPQFETEPDEKSGRGVVKHESARLAAIERIEKEAEKAGFAVLADTPCPVTGERGNQEHFLLLKKNL